MSQPSTERVSKKFWVIDTEGIKVSEEDCLSCPNTHSEVMWFCPKYGFTGSVGGSIFETRSQAVRALQTITQRKLHNAQEAHEKAMAL